MISFEHTHFGFLILTAIIPLLLLWYYIRWKNRKSKTLASSINLKRQLRSDTPRKQWIKWSLLSVGILFLSIAAMNLRMGSGTEKVDRNGVDIMIALDVSNSMLAEDMSPNRLDRAKTFIRQFLSQLHNDRVGLVLFAGRSYLQSPLTVDQNAVKMMLNAAQPTMIQSQGTNISEAIALSMKSFNQKEKKYKTLVIISDGEDHEPAAVAAAQSAKDEGVIIHTIGVGSSEGSTFIDPNTGQNKVDRDGNIVITKLNEEALNEISNASGGTHQLLYNTGKVASTLIATINNMDKRNQGAVIFTEYKSYYQWILFLGLLFLIAHFLIPNGHRLSYEK